MAECSDSEMSDAQYSDSGCVCDYHYGKWMTCPACVKEMQEQCERLRVENAKNKALLQLHDEFLTRLQRVRLEK